MSELIIRHSQGVAKRSAASLAWTEVTDQLWLLSRLPGNIWIFILRSAYTLQQRPKLLCVLSTFQSKQSLSTLFFILCVSLLMPYFMSAQHTQLRENQSSSVSPYDAQIASFGGVLLHLAVGTLD